MRALKVQFAPEPAWKLRAWVLVLTLSVIAAVWTSWHAWQDWRQLQQTRQELQTLQAKQAQREAQRHEQEAALAAPKPYYKDAANWVRIASFPTEQVLHALESTQIEGVKVTSIDLNPDAATARVELEFADQAQLMRYLEQINAGEEKPRWNLLQAKMLKAGGGGTATITSVWTSEVRQR